MDELSAAGASSRAEYERRLSAHRERVRQQRPMLFGICAVISVIGIVVWGGQPLLGLAFLVMAIALLVNTLLITPNTVTAWATGAAGEVRTAEFLEPLRGEGFAVLHDRRIPGSRANIDHIVVGPTGVFAVETKSLAGQLKVRGDDVYVGGRRRTAMVDEAKREALAVQVVLAPELEALGLSVVPVLCIHRASLPWLGSHAGGVRIVSGKELVKRLRKAEVKLSRDQVRELATAAAGRLAPAQPTSVRVDEATPRGAPEGG